MDWNLVFLATFHLTLPIILLSLLYIAYTEWRGMFFEAGITTREIGLLVIGATSGMLANVPIVVFGNYLLALNVGGAIIPIALSVYFFYKRKIDLTLTFFGIAIISVFITLIVISKVNPIILPRAMQDIFFRFANSLSAIREHLFVISNTMSFDFLIFTTLIIALPLLLIAFLFREISKSFCAILAFLCISITTFLITKYIPDLGISAEFPYYLYPTLLGVGFAIVVYGIDTIQAAPFAYATTTLGNLIGADLYHLPELFVGKGFVGSVGGAGIFDLVFISGLLAMCIVFLFSPFNLRNLPRKFSQNELFKRKIRKSLYESDLYLFYGRFYDSIQSSFNAVVEKINSIGIKYGIKDYEQTLNFIRVDYIIRYNFDMLKKEMENKTIGYDEAIRAKMARDYLINYLNEREKEIYAFTHHRIFAFLIDFSIIIGIMLGLLSLGHYLDIYKIEEIISFKSIWTFAWIWWAWTIQMLYFTIFEGFFGQTPGKKILGIAILNNDLTKVEFIGAFTRNAVRFLDIILFFYMISIILIATTDKRVRLGDMVANTVVVRVG